VRNIKRRRTYRKGIGSGICSNYRINRCGVRTVTNIERKRTYRRYEGQITSGVHLGGQLRCNFIFSRKSILIKDHMA
jgi:hypothetical protein